MRTEILTRGAIVLFVCIMVAAHSYIQADEEVTIENLQTRRARYNVYYPMYTLPMVLLLAMIMLAVNFGWEYGWKQLLSWCFGIFTHISLLYLFLLLVIPFFRKYFSARFCAELWMLPTFLYLLKNTFMDSAKPLLVITIPNGIITIFMIIWLVGVVLVFSGHLVSHLSFRHHILKDAVIATDEKVRRAWRQEREYGNFQNDYEVVISPAAKTPLSIGLFKGTTKVVLPQKEYTEAELHLVFRHELIHIGREDSGAKFFMMFCTAFCWFNPLMWIAMRKSAEDLELSCDETVLLHADKESRETYAELILKTVGDDRGFTTCLSASASALRYRLSSIIKPRKRFNGGIILGVILFAFMMTSGYIALAYESSTGEEAIFCQGTAEEYVLSALRFESETESQHFNCTDEDAFKEYLAGLEFCRITGDYTFSEDENNMICLFEGNEGEIGVRLTDSSVRITQLCGEDYNVEDYYLTSEVDWDYIHSLLIK